MRLKSWLKKIIPNSWLSFYYKCLALCAAFFYRFPSEKLIVIGVTGTNGKSTTCNIIARVLEEAGYKVGMTTTVNFRLAGKEWINKTKMTMLGRFELQKMLRKMVNAGCDYAVIETSSQGIDQYRHLGINYDVAVFTNLHEEHIEAHGGFENYKRAKGKLFDHLKKQKNKTINGKEIKKVSVLNLDDMFVNYFWQFKADVKYGFGVNQESRITNQENQIVAASDIEFKSDEVSFAVGGIKINLKIPGLFNIYNSLATIAVSLSQGISLETIKQGLESFAGVPGRMEKIKISPKQDFAVYVDYAHDPAALEAVYRTVRPHVRGKLISVLGSAGGGRDKFKRPIFGNLADEFADLAIITNEDPYDEDPERIINEIREGIKNKVEGTNLWRILDRREAIAKAIGLASDGDIILITGKGAEQCIMSARGKKIPWDDREVTREELNKRYE
jgi:UDP-N-acetylmuramoyl-L-alanyl-D-glutamate--2,6-diaminopimelate ligase